MTYKLHIESQGKGENVILLHGWGLHSGVWNKVATDLAQHFHVHCVDLPGHGKSSRAHSGFTLDQLAKDVIQQLAFPADATSHWVGWSLGGLLACKIASLLPRQLTSLTLVATNLRFSQTEEWSCAIQRETLLEFADYLIQEPGETIQRFLGLQVFGQTDARETLRQLRQHILNEPPAEIVALNAGLDILLNADLRQTAKQISQPVLLISGDKDRLVPPDSQKQSVNIFPRARSHVIKDAGHAVFISQHEYFMNILSGFLYNVKAV